MENQPPEKRLSEIPMLYETEHIPIKEKTIYFHFFFASCDWFIAEFDGDDTFFGFAILNGDLEMAEWGYISYEFLRTVKINGLQVEDDLYWEIRKASEVDLIRNVQRWEG